MNVKKTASTKAWTDPDDARELTEEFFHKAKKKVGDSDVPDDEFRKAVGTARRGRPKAIVTKKPISIRLSPEVLDYFRSTGSGWQTRIDQALKEWIEEHRG